ASGGLAAAAAVSEASADHVYGWAAAHPIAEPFVTDPALRSPTVATIDLDDIVDAAVVASVMRANGVVDIESYRKLGRNQLRIAMFPATPTEDIERLTASLDHVFTALVD
ncbi:MAG: phosphoserine transaminase, partial [Acidimicrobiia bacterium]|nr:phosphoserine transaminase [Acidimicrobiia bacterium]